VFYNRSGTHYQGISKQECSTPGTYWHIYNNTFDLDAPTGAGAWQDEVFGGAGTCDRIIFKNNAVINSRVWSIAGSTHDYNAYDTSDPLRNLNGPNCSGSCPSTEAHWVTNANLGFVDITEDGDAPNYHLQPASPLIGAGTNVGLTKDFDGNPVPTTPSIGAFEAGSSSVALLLPPTNLRVIP
jgi:hypothetical protein